MALTSYSQTLRLKYLLLLATLLPMFRLLLVRLDQGLLHRLDHL